ncbi:exocyst complex component Sec5p [Monosporozyma unispora]|nr:hypothetical protein C6P44_004872 [Kazachstania unispora]
MNPFDYQEADLQAFYNLKDLNPTESWNQDSIVQFDLSKWNNRKEPAATDAGEKTIEPSLDSDTSSYEILKNLIHQQQTINNKVHGHGNQDDTLSNLEEVKDPLKNNQLMKSIIPAQFNNSQNIKHYLINQKEFDVKKFLRDIHSKDTFDDLTHSLDNLDYDIQSQSSHLQILVENNFTKYVKIKNRLDSIYKQFSDSSLKHSTQTNPSGNSFNKNVDIHVDELNEKVNDSIRATNLKLKPLLDTSSKIKNYQLTKQFIEANKSYFNLPRKLKKFLYANDYRNFILEYNQGSALYEKLKRDYSSTDSKSNGDNSKVIESQPKIIETIWTQVEKIAKSYRNQIWNKLTSSYVERTTESDGIDSQLDDANDILPLISRLLDLKIESNPLPDLLNTYLDHFENEISTVASSSVEKIIGAQKNILQITVNSTGNHESLEDNDGVDLSYYAFINKIFNGNSFFSKTRSVNSSGSLTRIESLNGTNEFLNITNLSHANAGTSSDPLTENSTILSGVLTDTPIIIEMWLLILKYVDDLGHIASKFTDTWENVDKFLNNIYQRTLENDKRKNNILVGDNSKQKDEVNIEEFLRLKPEEIEMIHSKGERIIKLLCNNLLTFFQSSQDSLLTNTKNVKKDSGISSDYGFLPPRANGLSCLRYLPMILEPLLKYLNNLAQLNISPVINDSIKHLVSIVIDRFVGAISSTKLRDISRFYMLEDWEVDTKIQEIVDSSNDLNHALSDKDKEQYEYGVTLLPDIVLGFQQYSIQTTRDIIFAYERLPSVNNVRIVDPPSKQLLVGVEIQQIISLEAVLEAILKNAAKDKDNPRNVHTLLTLTNLQYIKEITFPETLQYFDELFEWNLKDKPLEIFNLLNKMESSIFGNYLSDLKIHLRDILETKFHQIDWPSYTSNSFRVGDYIIETLMLLVTIHSECFKIGPQLISKILKDTQLFVARYLFEAFKPYVGNISADGLLQLCVDIMFFQEVLGNLLEQDTEATLKACLQNCFQNHVERMEKCIVDMQPVVQSNLTRTEIQFAAFK